MQFTSRGQNAASSAPQPVASPPHNAVAQTPKSKRKHIDWAGRTVRIEIFILLLGCALLLLLSSLYLALSNGVGGVSKQVDTSKYQAVFVNGVGGVTSGYNGSLYFGKITKINDKYLVLQDVYFLSSNTQQTSQAASNSNQTTLNKLGCDQLHAPYDKMVINQAQVAFWENLQDSGQVVTKIKEYKQQNPNGPSCTSASSSSSSTTPTSTTVPNTSTNSSTTNATSTTGH